MCLSWATAYTHEASAAETPARALLCPAFRAPHTFPYLLERGIPSAQPAQSARLSGSFMPTRTALQEQAVLTKLGAQLLDMRFAPHLTNCCDSPSGRPSSIGGMTSVWRGRSLLHLIAPAT